MNLERLTKPSEVVLDEIRALRKLCYLKLKRLVGMWGATEEQKQDLEENNQRFIDKGY